MWPPALLLCLNFDARAIQQELLYNVRFVRGRLVLHMNRCSIWISLSYLTLVYSYILDKLEGTVAHESLLEHLVEFLLDFIMQVPLFASILSKRLCGRCAFQQLGIAISKCPAVGVEKSRWSCQSSM